MDQEEVFKLNGMPKTDENEPELDADLYLYQLLALSKSVNNTSDEFAKAVKPMIDDQLKYVQAAAEALNKSADLRKQWGYNAAGIRAFAASLAKKFRANAADEVINAVIKNAEPLKKATSAKAMIGAVPASGAAVVSQPTS